MRSIWWPQCFIGLYFILGWYRSESFVLQGGLPRRLPYGEKLCHGSSFGRLLPKRFASSTGSHTPRNVGMRIMSSVSSLDLYDGADYKVYIARGIDKFRAGQVNASIADFDQAILLEPRVMPYMWQRGLSLYYAQRFEEGSAQFRKDVAVNPNDTEEAIWAFMCEVRLPGVGFDTARRNMLRVGRDRRPFMRAAYSMFAGESGERELALEMGDGNTLSSASPSYFYSNLYLGLYAEARGDETLAQKYISAAVKSPYASSGDYMHALAKVHQQLRGW
ncbi:unnamed protein product [Choristocarpus tenellus]